MEKKDLIKLLDSLLIPIGFKRKGNFWVFNEKEVNKIINLQKSQYGNAYYVNFGYVLNSLPMNGFVTHISNRLDSEDRYEQNRITELLDLSNDIEYTKRIKELTYLINERIINEIQIVKTENDILKVLESMKYLYTVPPFVLEHFKLPIKW